MKRLKTIIFCSIALCAVVVLLLIIIWLKKKKYYIYPVDKQDDTTGIIASNMNLIINASFSDLFIGSIKNFGPNLQTAQALYEIIINKNYAHIQQENRYTLKHSYINVLQVALATSGIPRKVMRMEVGGNRFTNVDQKYDFVLFGDFFQENNSYFGKYIYVYSQDQVYYFQSEQPVEQHDRFQIESGLLRCGQYSKQYGAIFFYDDKVFIIIQGEKSEYGIKDKDYENLENYIVQKINNECQICSAVYTLKRKY